MDRNALAFEITKQFENFPQVMAIALGGSQAFGSSTSSSDIDIYVFTNSVIPLAKRRFIVEKRGALQADLNLDYWDLGDQWFDKETGLEVDVMYWDTTWVIDQVDRILIDHQASLGYSTCHWHTLKNALPLFDRDDWLKMLQEKCNQPYPELLRNAIIRKNLPVLRDVIPSYANQIIKAISRKDLISINHRTTAFLASYFDIIFAINRIPHPGEKRLLELIPSLCDHIPKDMSTQITHLLAHSLKADERMIKNMNDLIDGLEELLNQESTNEKISIY